MNKPYPSELFNASFVSLEPCLYCRLTIILMFFVLSISGLSGCAGLHLGHNPREEVRQAAENYWKARVAGDWVTCYKYEEVSKLQKESLAEYVHRQGSLIYKSARIVGVEMKGPDRAVVTVALEYYLPAFGTSHAFKTNVQDNWAVIDGKWYHNVDKRLMKDNEQGKGVIEKEG